MEREQTKGREGGRGTHVSVFIHKFPSHKLDACEIGCEFLLLLMTCTHEGGRMGQFRGTLYPALAGAIVRRRCRPTVFFGGVGLYKKEKENDVA